MPDLVIRNARIADGTGKPAFTADVAIDGDRIIAVGGDIAQGREEIDADGKLVTPGFVDIHTHFDGQATWDPILAPTSWHGVTTILIGNCGVGFAPARPDRRDWLISLMAGVEDIPVATLEAGLPWDWESFPDYMDALAARRHTIDIGTQLPHGALRSYVMGDRAGGAATADDIAAMAQVAEEAVSAGALGFSTCRSVIIRSLSNEPVPGAHATSDELKAIARGMMRGGSGVLQMVSELNDPEQEIAMMRDISIETSAPVNLVLLELPTHKEGVPQLIERFEEARSQGAELSAQIAARGLGYLMGWQATTHPFFLRPSWRAIENKAWDEQWAALRDPAFRTQMLSERDLPARIDKGFLTQLVTQGWDLQFPLGEQANYEPAAEDSIAAIARRRGMSPYEVAYDVMCEEDGRAVIYMPVVNYVDGNLDKILTLMKKPWTVAGLADGGAHCGVACDAGMPTFVLSYWGRDREGGRLSLEEAVKSQTLDPAVHYGLHDRGVLAPGYLADINIIDFEQLHPRRPYMAFDLPADGRRYLQKATGYVATIKRGRVIFRDGEHMGEFPGQVIRGRQPAMT